MSGIQWPLRRCIRLTIVMLSGVSITQDVWSWTVTKVPGDQVTDVSYKWAGERTKAKTVRADQVAIVMDAKGPLRWRGWRAA